MKVGFKKIVSNLIIFIIVVIIIGFIFAENSKNEVFNRLKNRKFTIGKYLKDETPGRAGVVAIYVYNVKNKQFTESQSKGNFPESTARYGHYYFVSYNSKRPSNSFLYLNIEVPDSLIKKYKDSSFRKLPIKKFQTIADSTVLNYLTTGVSKYFPPYYDKEDLPELEYLIED